MTKGTLASTPDRRNGGGGGGADAESPTLAEIADRFNSLVEAHDLRERVWVAQRNVGSFRFLQVVQVVGSSLPGLPPGKLECFARDMGELQRRYQELLERDLRERQIYVEVLIATDPMTPGQIAEEIHRLPPDSALETLRIPKFPFKAA